MKINIKFSVQSCVLITRINLRIWYVALLYSKVRTYNKEIANMLYIQLLIQWYPTTGTTEDKTHCSSWCPGLHHKIIPLNPHRKETGIHLLRLVSVDRIIISIMCL